MTAPEPSAELDDDEWWDDMRVALNYGLIEPAEGTPEAEAFRRMAKYARSECDRVAADNERDAAYAWNKAARDAEPEAGK